MNQLIDNLVWGVRGKGGGREWEGRGKRRECRGARKVVCPGARAGSRRACAGPPSKIKHNR